MAIKFERTNINPRGGSILNQLLGRWEYIGEDGSRSSSLVPITNRKYDYGENQQGDPYYIKYSPISQEMSYFNLFPLDDNYMYWNREGPQFAEFSPYYDPNYINLEELEVRPKTAQLELSTYYPLSSQYPFTGHSALGLWPDYEGGPISYISKDMSASDYNLVTNNCADATRTVLEEVLGIKMHPWFFTTPGDVRDFLIENGGRRSKDGKIYFNLNEDQALQAQEIMDNLNRKWYNKEED